MELLQQTWEAMLVAGLIAGCGGYLLAKWELSKKNGQ